MDNPAARSLMETVRQINEIGRRAKSGQPGPEDYLRAVSQDPTTEWFTELLREKNEQLQTERRQSDRLANALRAWHREKAAGTSAEIHEEAELRLFKILQEIGIIHS
jgi:hypothetical protein